LQVDPRSLGLFRVSLALMLCFDVLRRWPNVFEFYSNSGWLPNHFALFKPMSGHLFSVYHAFSTPGEVKLLLSVHLAIALCFLVGWHTRLMNVLLVVLTTSLNSRNIALENGGWVMLNLITLWSAFLPLGRRFSIDAVRSTLRCRAATGPPPPAESPALTAAARAAAAPVAAPAAARAAATPAAAADGFALEPSPRFDVRPWLSLAFLAVLLQWALVYYFNAVSKSGPSWRDGNAIYYFIHQDRLTQSLGIWVRGWLPLSATRAMTHVALVIEYAIAALLVVPVFYRPARMLAWVLGVGLHVGIAVFASLGPFVWVMLVPYPLFIAPEHWAKLEGWLRRRSPALEVRIREEPGGRSLGRLVKALDTLGLTRVAYVDRLSPGLQVRRAAGDSQAEAPGSADALAAGQASRPWLCDGRALSLLGRSLIAPRVFSAWCSLPGVRRLWGWAIERLVGGGQLERDIPRGTVSPLRQRVGRAGFWCGQALALLLMVATGSQVLVENRSVPAALKPQQRPAWLEAIVVYPRLFQGWSMFAPDPPREDGRVIVDGRTQDGRKLDPLTGHEPSFDVPRSPDVWNDGDWAAFHTRIAEPRFSAHYPALRDLLLRYHEKSGRPQDRLVSFEVWYGTQAIPAPGAPAPPPRFRKLLGYGRVLDPGVPRVGR